MRRPSPVELPVALTIAGSDSGGGAGIQADLATMAARDVYGTSAVTAVTAQNSRGVERSHVLSPAEVTAQIEAVTGDFDVGAAKTGMLGTAPIVETVTEHARDLTAPLVVDPVMVAASGDRLLEPAAEDAYEDLVAEAAVVTPNADEAAVLTGVEVTDESSAQAAGEHLRDLGADAALVKGGHVTGDPVTDVLVTADGSTTLSHPRVETDATHGSGCALAAAIAADLASGHDLEDAVAGATEFLAKAVRHHYDVGTGPGAVNHAVELRDRAARDETRRAVRSLVDELLEVGIERLVPEVGMNVAGATPAATSVEDVAAVDGRIVTTLDGARPVGPVRFGASSHVARFLLQAREVHPKLRFAVNCRYDAAIREALESRDWSVAAYDRSAEPEPVKAEEGGTMGWAARQVFDPETAPPAAVVDEGEVGKEAITKLVAADPSTLVERVRTLAANVA